jgi:hypothetical protein
MPNGFLQRLVAWWRSRLRRSVREEIAVEFDQDSVQIRVLADLDAEWNQTFRWADVERVCFTDAGMYQSDIIRISVRGRKDLVVVPIEAAGGSAFFGAICNRGLLPEHMWRRAMGETSGRTYCWPPLTDE